MVDQEYLEGPCETLIDLPNNCQTLLQVFLRRLQFNPLATFVSFIDEAGFETRNERRSTVEFANEIMTVADWLLQQKGLEVGDRVGLVFLPSIEFLVAFWACMFVGVIPIPLPPPLRLSIDLPGFVAIVSQVECRFVLSHGTYIS